MSPVRTGWQIHFALMIPLRVLVLPGPDRACKCSTARGLIDRQSRVGEITAENSGAGQ